jgi:hypothetical protein
VSTPHEPGGLLVGAVQGTIQGSAQISLRTTVPFQSEPSEQEFQGVIDFASDRCQLESKEGRVVLDGSSEYSELDDGRWSLAQGTPGTWGIFHPRGALEDLRMAATNVTVLNDGSFSVQLDRDVVDAISALGLSPAWTVGANVALDDESRITSLGLSFTDRTPPSPEPGPSMYARSMSLMFEFTSFGDPVHIDLPPTESTISVEDHLDEFLQGDLGASD